MNRFFLLTAIIFAAAGLQAEEIPFEYADFEAGVVSYPNGFDAVPDMPGWQDDEPVYDAGVEGDNAWWGTYDGYSAFMSPGDSAYLLSDYIVKAGDEYAISFVAKSWDGFSQWTASLFYDEPGNVIGSYSTSVTGTWTTYSNATPVAATDESIGGTLGILFENTGSGFANLDDVKVDQLNLPGPATIIDHPENQTVIETRPVTFDLTYGGAPPVYIQWYRDSSMIPGATNETYTITETALSDHGAVFHVEVENTYSGNYFSDTSSNATLTVTADTTAPTLDNAISTFPDGVRVRFSEPVSAETALNVDNYMIIYGGGSLPITDAEFGVDHSTVILTTASQSLESIYTLRVSNVQDRSSAANTIVSGSQVSFLASLYTTDDVGNPAIVSSASGVPGGMDLTAGGSGIGGTSDQFGFSHNPYFGDFDIQVRIDQMDFSDQWARAGLMARDELGAESAFAAVFSSPGPVGCQFMSRLSEGGNTSAEGFFPTVYPDMWLRLRRTGNLFEGFAGIDGNTWQLLGSRIIPMSGSVEVGYALTSSDPAVSTTARFLNDSAGGGSVVSSIALPFEPLGPSSRRGAMVISEIMLDTPSEWGGTNSLEFIEIYNTGLITEDLTGHRFSGEIDYTFPDGTTLAPGEFIVVAKDPSAAQAFYGIDCFGPYDGKLNNGGGTLRLRNEINGILLVVEYDNKAPWPVAAFGTGHSMVLSHPSYGENDPRAWSASDRIGGSPGTFEGFGVEPARGVVINEYLAHTDLPLVDYVELFNTGSSSVDLSGAWLSDEAGTNRYRIADGTTIPARGFLTYNEIELGFALSADGEQIFLVNSNETRVLDAVSFRGQANGVTEGRYPDGAPGFQPLVSITEGLPNTAPRNAPVVINEIMYNPISDSKNDEYVELYNRSASPVDLTDWRLQGGISYQFPSNTVIAANGYLVVAENQTNLVAKYPQLNNSNTYGNYGGSLANGGERIALAMPEDLIATNEFNMVTTNIFYIPIDEVTYLDGGRWGEWSDGGGSSLELIDPDADNRQPANWADSDESDKADWTTIDVTEVLENGQSAPDGTADHFEFFLQGAGEMIVDDLEFRNNGGGNMLPNGGFSGGSSNWVFGGVVRNSFVESGAGFDGSAALHLVSVARGDMGANQADQALTGTATVGGSNTGTIRARVRWLKGSPYVLFRLRGHWMEASLRANVPSDCGSPGLANSRLVANAGPAIYDVVHGPILPDDGEDVVVTTRAVDPDGINSIGAFYRIDPAPSYTFARMNDDGTGGDAVAGDGIYSATIPGQSAGTMAAFFISANDGSASSTFPAAAPDRECLVRWGESTLSSSLGTYRLWVTDVNLDFWADREENANDNIDATFVYGDYRVVYNVGTMYSASPFHTQAYNGPLGSFACDYEINFQPGEQFLGTEPFVLSAEDLGNNFWFDYTTQVDMTATWIGRKLGQQYNYRRHVNMMLNGSLRGMVYLDTQQPNGDMLDQYHRNDSNGDLRKVEDWFEFRENNITFDYITATLEPFYDSNGDLDVKRYRWNWRPRTTEDHDQWDAFTNLVETVNGVFEPDFETRVEEWVDVRNFVRPLVVNRIAGNWDSYGYERGKNMYMYKPDDQGWRLLQWDIELALGNDSRPPNDPITDMHDPSLYSFIFSTPAIAREYYMAFQEAVDTALDPAVANPILDERYANLVANGIPLASPDSIKSYIADRRTYLQGVLPVGQFSVDGPDIITVATNRVTLTGTAPLQVADLRVNDIAYPVDWTYITEWSIAIPLLQGTNELVIAGVDSRGRPVADASELITVINTGAGSDPLDAVVINEWMADNDSFIMDPADGDYEDWFELYNAGAAAVDLGGCYLTDDLIDPFQFQIPANGHYVIPPGGYLLVWADGESGQNSTNHPDLHVSFSLRKSGESIGLYAPDGREIDAVTFGAQATDISEGRSPDGSDTIMVLPLPTPGAENGFQSGPMLGEVGIDGTNMVFSWSSVIGPSYQVYYKDDLLDDFWIPDGPAIPGTGGVLSSTNSIQEAWLRFYMLEVTP